MKLPCCWVVLFTLLATTTNAETVEVKYRGKVNLASYTCPELKSSSFVKRLCYQGASDTLIVQLGATHYQYCRVPSDIFSNWIAAASLGHYYNQVVKGQGYDCR